MPKKIQPKLVEEMYCKARKNKIAVWEIVTPVRVSYI